MPDPVFAHTEAKSREPRNVTWNFEGEVVLITGAAHGQAAVHAREFAKAGADLALCDIAHNLDSVFYDMGTSDELEQVAEECRGLGVKVITRICDVRDDGQVEAFVADTVKELGRLDVAIANAGIAGIVEVTDM